jgi:glycosyltransferase involved in cell wall biosynthesis
MSEAHPHIAIYLYSFYDGGAERIIVNLMQKFVEKGLSIDLLVNTKTYSSYFLMVPSKVRIFEFNVGYRKGLLRLVDYLKNENPATLLSTLHYSNEIAILASKLSGSKTKVVVREGNHLSTNAKRENTLQERLTPISTRFLYPFADNIVAISKGVAQDLRQSAGIAPEKIKVIYNPAIMPNILDESNEAVHHPWLKDQDIPVVLGVGRLTKQKDFTTLIKAFGKIINSKDARLIILGDGKEKKNLVDLTKVLKIQDKVDFPGFAQNPYAYMAQASAFVLSSAWEGFGNVIVEAMSVGTPVICTDCPSGPSEILADGKYGELVPVGNSQKMSEAILKVLSERQKAVSPEWLNQFSIDYASQRYLEALGLA